MFSVITIALFTLILILHSLGFLNNLNYLVTDNLYGGKTPLNSIIIVGIDDRSIEQLGRWPWDRSVFANLTKNLGNPKVVGFDIGFYDSTTSDSTLKDSFEGKTIVLASQVKSFTLNGQAESLLTPQSILLTKNSSSSTSPSGGSVTTGYVNILTHPDGITRTVNFNLSTTYPHFAYQIFEKAFNQPSPVSSDFYINFPAAPYTFHIIPVSDIINHNVDPETFTGKIVLVGAVSPSLKDHYFVPTSSGIAMPGVEVHASIIQTLLLQNNFNHQSNFSLYLLIFLFLIIVGSAVFFLRPITTICVLLSSILIYELAAIFLVNYHLLLNLVYPPLTIMVSYPLFYAASYTIEQRERKKVENAFGKYLSPTIVTHLLKNKETLELGGEERELTILFSDIRGFTTLSEKLTPTELVSTLNEYFNAMSAIIIKEKGIVDKYIGDAIMAFWGAPMENKNHPIDAAKSAVGMKRTLKKIKTKLEEKGITIDIGIGINTGTVVVGNIGSNDRFDYTVIGDAVNLSSRVEGLTKEYGVTIIITAHTKRHLPKEYITRELDLVAVKGKTEPVPLFELIDVHENIESDTFEFIKIYESALAEYRQGNFEQAQTKFKESHAMKHDKASKLMIERCEEYIIHPPTNWDGVYIAKSK